MSAVHLLVGHRGVGKTTFLRRAAIRCAEAADFIDLDHEIERHTKTSIRDLFKKGESKFREIEKTVLRNLVEEAKKRHQASGMTTWIAAGAGLLERPPEAYVVWVRRSTDAAGRIFLDRPRLDSNLSPLKEYRDRFPEREKRFAEWADEVLHLPEGYEGGLEEFLILRRNIYMPRDLTVLPRDVDRLAEFWARREKWNLRRMEVRDDLLSPEQMAKVLKTIPPDVILYSRRKLEGVAPKGYMVDHALELGEDPTARVMSLHTRRESISETLDLFPKNNSGSIFKLAIEIKNFSELLEGHKWWMKDPVRRAFLPSSKNGRWQWYRSLFGPQMPLHFIRENDGSAPDQPYVWQTLLQAPLQNHFAAVLGSPIQQSRSPMEHADFFANRGMPFVAIEVLESEISEAWPVLVELGLTHAAITSPLKKWAGQAAGAGQNVNTLWFSNGRWQAANTDKMALEQMARDDDFGSMWVWGAGAMSENLKSAFKDVRVISARQGVSVSPSPSAPDTLVWATNWSREFVWPASDLKPKRVFDLNYTDDSPGLEWAVKNSVDYHSGLRLFKLQADEQRRLWSSP